MAFTLPAVPPDVLARIPSPAMVVFRDRVTQNIDQMIRMAGSVTRLRPHCKTHKMAAVVRLLAERGITKHKAATVAEVEMLAEVGASDVMLAYNPVGPNVARVVELGRKFPNCRISVTADHAGPIAELASAAERAGRPIHVALDINPGLNRTGIVPEGELALDLVRQIAASRALRFAGFHVYDGQQRQQLLADRRQSVQKEWPRVLDLRQRCEAAGIPVPAIVCGGTPTFPVYAEMPDSAIELSPGTCIFHDAGYGSNFPDLPFQPAAAVLTRVISRPSTDRLTLDLGNKAIAADPPKGQRAYFPELPDAVQDIHNEEHLALVTANAARFQPGDCLFAIPMHVCPTSALYERVIVIDNGKIVDEWTVTSRNRCLTI